MKLVKGDPPKWKSKLKASPLDTDVEFLKLQSIILTGKLGPFEQIGMLIYEDADGKGLKTKNPARLVRDRLNRLSRTLIWERSMKLQPGRPTRLASGACGSSTSRRRRSLRSSWLVVRFGIVARRSTRKNKGKSRKAGGLGLHASEVSHRLREPSSPPGP
jgi:hypothetical protein